MIARLITAIAAMAVAISLAGCSATGGAPTAAPTTATTYPVGGVDVPGSDLIPRTPEPTDFQGRCDRHRKAVFRAGQLYLSLASTLTTPREFPTMPWKPCGSCGGTAKTRPSRLGGLSCSDGNLSAPFVVSNWRPL